MTTVLMPSMHPVSPTFSVSGYRDVDAATDQWAYYGFLDSVAEAFQDVISGGIDRLRLAPGHSVVDIGCGHGSSAGLLARQVGPCGRVVGLDASRAMIAEACRRFDGGGLAVDFQVGDALDLPFDDASFDAARADRVLMFLDDPGRALAELVRVTKAGGRIVVTEGDIGSHLVDAADVETTRSVLTTLADRWPTAWSGRRLRGMFIDAGLLEVELDLVPILSTSFAEWNNRLGIEAFLSKAVEQGVLARERAFAWLNDLRARDAGGKFTGVALLFTVAATR